MCAARCIGGRRDRDDGVDVCNARAAALRGRAPRISGHGERLDRIDPGSRCADRCKCFDKDDEQRGQARGSSQSFTVPHMNEPSISSRAIPTAQPLPGSVVWPGCSVAGDAGEPVVLLHSSLSSKSQWTSLCERMSTRFRVIALDLWGYGENAMPAFTQRFTLDDEVRLVA